MSVVPLHRDRAATIGGSDVAAADRRYIVTAQLKEPLVEVVAANEDDALTAAIELLSDRDLLDDATWSVWQS